MHTEGGISIELYLSKKTQKADYFGIGENDLHYNRTQVTGTQWVWIIGQIEPIWDTSFLFEFSSFEHADNWIWNVWGGVLQQQRQLTPTWL